jgi:hypothetical protein
MTTHQDPSVVVVVVVLVVAGVGVGEVRSGKRRKRVATGAQWTDAAHKRWTHPFHTLPFHL